MRSFRLYAAVPQALLFASGAAFTLAVAIVIGIALSRDRRREVEPVEEPSKLPWWLQTLMKVLPPLPLEQMVKESPSTPSDVPMHPRAAAVWREHGYL